MGRGSTVLEYAFEERTPFDYQRVYIDDVVTRWQIWKAARQIGKSEKGAHKATLTAVSIRGYRCVFTSMNLEDAREKIEYSRELYDALKDARIKSLPAITRNNVLEMRFQNGSRLISMFTPRGKAKADLVLDEFAHYSNPRKVYSAALPIMIHGGQCTIMSTPLHARTMFNQIFTGDGGKFTAFRRYQVEWWHCPIHCRDVPRARLLAPQMDTEERVKEFGTLPLLELFDNLMLDLFQQEFECLESDDEAAWLPWDMILRSSPSGDDSIKQFDSLEALREGTRGKVLFAGFDVGRTKDRSELSVFVEENGGIYERFTLSLKRKPFTYQEEILYELLSLGNLRRLAIDQTGIGMQLAENCKKKAPSRVFAIHFSGAWPETLSTSLKTLMDTGDRPVKIWFHATTHKNFQMHSIRKSFTETGRPSYKVGTGVDNTGTDSQHHHADVYWARALGAWCYTDLRKIGRPRVGWA